MLNRIRKKIAYKLAMVIAIVVALVSTVSIFHFNQINKKNLTESLRISLTNAIHFSEHVYARPLWDFNDKEIERLNRIVLQNQLIVAVNIFDMDTFMNGTMKELSSPGDDGTLQWIKESPKSPSMGPSTPSTSLSNPYASSIDGEKSPHSDAEQRASSRIFKKLFSPYVPPAQANHIKKIMGEILLDGKVIGHFELFYTEAFINQAVAQANRQMVITFGMTALLICMAIIFSVTRINRPIETLAHLSERVVRENTYDITVTRSHRIDEVGVLVNGFADMMAQIRLKENERNQLHDELEKSLARFRRLFKTLQDAVDSANYSHRIPHEKEDDELSGALNKVMAALESADRTTQNQSWLKNGQAELSALIGRERGIESIASTALSFIATYVDAKVGTLFLKNLTGDRFDLMTSFAYKHRKGSANHFKPGEGLAGQAALEKKTILFSELPVDYMHISSSLGYTPPTHLIVIPMLYEKEVQGVMEFGACAPFSEIQMELLEKLADIVAVAIHGAQINEKMAILLAQTQEQAEELRVQQEELRSTNEELEEQANVLRESEEKLQVQQEELQASNEELEEKTALLQSQKKEIQETNDVLTQKQKEIEEKAELLAMETRYKSEFLANMSHELRTPLNSLLILANMLSEEGDDNLTDDQREAAASIYRSGQNLLHLINDILDLSKIEANRVELSLSTFSPDTLASHFNSEFQHMAMEKGLTFSIIMDDNLPKSITSDMHRLEQILRNLMGNAVKFTDNGEITLHFSRPDIPIRSIAPQVLTIEESANHNGPNHSSSTDTAPDPPRQPNFLSKDNAIAIHVKDTGIGISKTDQKRIFEAFRQADGSIRRKHDGTGLGLSISKKLAHLLGGEILLQSEKGRGSTFSLIIPESIENDRPTPSKDQTPEKHILTHPTETNKTFTHPISARSEPCQSETVSSGNVPVPPMSATSPSGEANGQKAGTADKKRDSFPPESFDSPKTMLIIEDDPEFAVTLKKFFTRNGYETVIKHSGEEGIRYVLEKPPTAIILDLRLPGIDGWTVMNELKRNPSTQHIPVHIMSGYDHRRKGMEQGAVGYLTKPVSVDELNKALDKIETVLSNKVKQLLVVEDNKELQFSILKLMGAADIQITSAETGQDAILRLKEKPYDCMILDLGLPDISGFDILDTISQDDSIDMLPVIVFTGRDLSAHETERLEQYASTIVLKNAVSMERLIDETALFLHRVESEIPQKQQRAIRNLREQDAFLKEKQVMVVDDDMRNAFALSKYLKSKGMVVTIAQNGEKAVELIQNDPPPDIVLMDIMMPVMDGYETIREIRKMPRFKTLPIIALTAKAMSTDREECIRCGADDYLSKPLDTSKLLTLLRVWLYN